MATNSDIAVRVGADVGPLKQGMKEASIAVVSLGKSGDATGQKIKKLSTDLDFLASSSKRTASSYQSVNRAAGEAGKGMGGLSRVAGQLGFQLQDVAVQAQMGTSAFTILGQQGSQVASVFGPGGAVIGAILAVGAALGGVLFKSLTTVSAEIEDLIGDIESLGVAFADLSKVQQEAIRIDLLTQIAKQGVELSMLNTELAETRAKWNELRNDTGGFNLFDFGKDSEKLAELNDKMTTLPAAIQNAKDRAAELKSALDAINAGTYEFGTDKQGKDAGDQAEDAAEKTEFAYGRALQSFKNYGVQLVKEQEQLQESLRQAELTGVSYDRPLAAFMNYGEELKREQEQLAILMEKEQEALNDNMLAGYQAYAASRLQSGEDFRQTDLEKNQEYLDALTEQERKAALQKAALEQSIRQQRFNAIQKAFSDLSTLMDTENKKAFQIGKAAAISSAIIDSIAGAQKAFTALAGIPVVGPALGVAAAGVSLAAGAVRVGQISSTTFGSKSVPSSAGGSAAPAATPETAPQPVNISLAGESFGRGSVIDLISEINEAIGDGARLRVS